MGTSVDNISRNPLPEASLVSVADKAHGNESEPLQKKNAVGHADHLTGERWEWKRIKSEEEGTRAEKTYSSCVVR